MNLQSKRLLALFADTRRAGTLVAPGDADCRWRAAAALETAQLERASGAAGVPAANEDPAGPGTD